MLVTGCAGTTTMQAAPAGTASPTAAAQPAFGQPPELRSSNGLLRVRLVVEQRTVRLAGQDVRVMTYNGHYMPPTIRLLPGDRLDLTLVNRLGDHTNLHTHGWHVSPSGNSDNVYLHIMPGQSYHYSYRLSKDFAPGTYWYHSHAHPHAEAQVFAGLSGAIVVDGLKRYLPPGLRNITERLIALKDFQVKNGAIPTSNIDSGAPTTRTVNGLVNPVISIRPGETQLWRLANIGADIAYNVQLQGSRFTVLAQDANPVDRTWSEEALLMPPGSRFDVLVQGPPEGRTQMITTAYSTGPDGDSYPETTLATLVSSGSPIRQAAIPADFAEIDDLSHDPVARRRTITFSENDQTNQFFINGKQWAADRIDVRAKLNTTEEWVIRNVSDEQHTFHVHVNDFQLMSVNGKPYHFRGWQDTVQLPVRGEVVIRMRFRNFTGKYPYHCHILNHEDNGMMANVEVVP
ncbi:multicopper oxidase family protein [Nonomuraea longispora]|uniref:multicopper oxidase family protein n=1 Tax=Nonomuraea longispora TaxID=1848320 RepID=UPI001C6FE148|nr:multicopper oxidase family protein [Nonomuraea longispora]